MSEHPQHAQTFARAQTAIDTPGMTPDSRYTLVNHRLLRNGYTTGSCAAAAAGAAVSMLLTGQTVEEMPLMTPAGILLHLFIEEITFRGKDGAALPERVRCAVRKDGGDDVDATDGMLIFADVTRISGSDIRIKGGEGIGVVTRPGLDQPIGNPAINSGPRSMIINAVREICTEHKYNGGIAVVISAPEGRAVAEKTFNPNMGIEGGISILGTTGIVMPMSRKALLDSIRLEMNMLHAAGLEYIVASPGNYGASFLKNQLGLNPACAMKCSNYVGDTLDMAEEIGIKGILFTAHIGKFIKLSGGIMNTHSRESDARMELLASAALRAGADAKTCRALLDALTTDEALLTLRRRHPELAEDVYEIIANRIQYHLDRRTAGKVRTGAILFAEKNTWLTETKTAAGLRRLLDRQKLEIIK